MPTLVGGKSRQEGKTNYICSIAQRRKEKQMNENENTSVLNQLNSRDQIGEAFLNMTQRHIQLMQETTFIRDIDSNILREIRENMIFIFKNF